MTCNVKIGEESLTWLYHLHHDNSIPYEVRGLASILPSYAPSLDSEYPYIYVSQETLMLMTGRSESVIRRHLTWLTDHHWLIKLSNGSDSGRLAKASTYIFHTPEHMKVTRENPTPTECGYWCRLKEHRSPVTAVKRTPVIGDGTPVIGDGKHRSPVTPYTE